MPRGGARPGAGRPDKKNKKQHINLYVETEVIDLYGNTEETRKHIYEFLENQKNERNSIKL